MGMSQFEGTPMAARSLPGSLVKLSRRALVTALGGLEAIMSALPGSLIGLPCSIACR